MRRIVTLALLLALCGWSCSSGSGAVQAGSAGSVGVPNSPDPLMDFNGIWRGRSVSTMNAASAKITFNIKREGNHFKGDYRCAPGNAVCRNNVQRGWVTGQISARGFRIEMEDSSWCTYFMDDFYPPKADGEYTCYMNGGIADQGTFKLKGPPPEPAAEAAPVQPQT
ncbi:MAG TPA: hypothetical protein VNE82_01070 [Candidatus Binataceae bacterium]|nr:hypothetical protein [Candidatus Binataceae bacterium]